VGTGTNVTPEPTTYISPAVPSQTGAGGRINSNDTGTRVPYGDTNTNGGKTPSAMSKNQ